MATTGQVDVGHEDVYIYFVTIPMLERYPSKPGWMQPRKTQN